MEVTKTFTFDMGHRLSNYIGLCHNLHGHTYLLEVTLASKELDSLGMVLDFSILKNIVKDVVLKKFDHKLLLKKDDSITTILIKSLPEDFTKSSLTIVKYNPTAENMAKDILTMLTKALIPYNKPVFVRKIKLYETPTSFAELTI